MLRNASIYTKRMREMASPSNAHSQGIEPVNIAVSVVDNTVQQHAV